MKKIKIMKNVFLVFILMYATALFSIEKNELATKIEGSKEMPLEINLLLESIQNSVDYERIIPIIRNIDSYARVLSKEDIFLIGKVEIYKTLLKGNEVLKKPMIDGNSLETLKAAIKNAQDPFLRWFLEALLKDCEALMANANYKDYLLQKNNGIPLKIELKKIEKKVQLLYRWVSKIFPEANNFQEILKAELAPVQMDALKNIEESFFLMAKGTLFTPLPFLTKSPSDLKFFSLKEVKAPKKAISQEKSVEDILAPLTEETKPLEAVLPKPSKDDWLNEDNAPLNLKNLPKPSDDADWLQDF